MTDTIGDFPYEIIRRPDEDYFQTIREAEVAGYALTQIWSVVESEGTYTYGPPHHWINLVGYVATAEHHDNDTYFHEEPEYPDDYESEDHPDA